MFVSYRRRYYLLPRAAITAEIVVSDEASKKSGCNNLGHPRNFFFQRVPTRICFFPTSSHAVFILFGGLGLGLSVWVNFVAMVKVSKLLGSNFNPNPTSNFALTLI